MNFRSVVVLVSAAATVWLTGCATEPVDPFAPSQMGQRQRDASANQNTADLMPLPTTYRSWEPAERRARAIAPTSGPVMIGNEPRVAMKLEDIVRKTVANNLEVKTASYGPSVEASRTEEAIARFDPTFFTNVGAEISDRRTAGVQFFDPSAPITQRSFVADEQKQRTYTLESGIKQILEGGGQVQASYRLRQTETDPTSTVLDPYREADLILQITQPLLRDFGGVVNQARIEIARNTTRISILDFRKQVEDQCMAVEQAYWQLVAAVREVEIQEQSVRDAERTTDIINIRKGNDATDLELTQAQGAAELRRASLRQARAQVRDLSDTIKQLMNDPDLPISGPDLVVPDSPALERPVQFSMAELIDAALVHRLELAQQQLRVDNATVTLGAAKNNLLPQLNFVGSYNPSGLGGTLGTAIDDQFEFNQNSYSAGLQFEIPLGNREARSIYRRSLQQRSQAVAQYDSAVNQVIEDVRKQHRAVETNWEVLQMTRTARFSNERTLQAIEAKEAADEPLTPTVVQFKLDQQLRVATARSQEATALSNYNTAIALLEKAKGTLLRYNNITLAETGMQMPSLRK